MSGPCCVRPDAASDLRVLSACVRVGSRHSRTRLLLPEPLTPVTTTSRFKGKRAVRFFRLFAAALWRVSQPLVVVAFPKTRLFFVEGLGRRFRSAGADDRTSRR